MREVYVSSMTTRDLGAMTRWFSWVGGVLVAEVFSLCSRSAWLSGTGSSGWTDTDTGTPAGRARTSDTMNWPTMRWLSLRPGQLLQGRGDEDPDPLVGRQDHTCPVRRRFPARRSGRTCPLRPPMSQSYSPSNSATERGDNIRPMLAIGQLPGSCGSSPLSRR